MHKILFFLLSLTVIGITAHTQNNQIDFNNFTYVKSEGEIPDCFLELSQNKYEQDKENISDELKRKERNLQDEFYLKSNYMVDDLLLSGRVLFGDPITNYINKVAKELLKNYPELYDSLQFYTLKTTSVNALSTNQGIIFINMGLIARLNNEAELAFVLAHEISHFTKKHVLNSFIEKDDILNHSGKYRGISYDAIDQICMHSKEIEFEADSLGYLMIANSKYNSKGISDALDMLHYSYLPYDEVSFDKTFFNSTNLLIPKCYFSDSLSPISKEEDYYDEESSHPNIHKRRLQYKRIIKNNPSIGSDLFILDKNEFEYIRKIARFETIRLQLIRREYGDAIYCAYVLLKDYPNNKYLEISIAKALYGLTKYKNADNYKEAAKSYTKTEGESQQIHFFLRQLSKKQLNTISLKYTSDLLKKYPNEEILKTFQQDLILDMVMYNDMKLEDFNIGSSVKINTEFELPNNIDRNGKNKLIRKCQMNTKGFYKNAFSKPSDTIGFKVLFEIAEQKLAEFEDFEKLSYKDKQKVLNAKQDELKKTGYKLFIKNLLVFDPFRYYYNNFASKDYIKSEDRKLELSQTISSAANKSDIEIYMVDSKDLKKDEIDKFNELSVINEWLLEKYTHGDLNMTPTSTDILNTLEISKKQKYFCHIGVITFYNKNDSYYFFNLFDIQSGETVYSNRLKFNTDGDKKIEKTLKADFKIIAN